MTDKSLARMVSSGSRPGDKWPGGGSAAGSRGQVAPPEGAWAQRLAPVRMSDGPCRAPLARVIGGRRPSGSPPLASVAPPESVRRDAPNWAPNCTKSSKK